MCGLIGSIGTGLTFFENSSAISTAMATTVLAAGQGGSGRRPLRRLSGSFKNRLQK